jgi:hypothetical protein
MRPIVALRLNFGPGIRKAEDVRPEATMNVGNNSEMGYGHCFVDSSKQILPSMVSAELLKSQHDRL